MTAVVFHHDTRLPWSENPDDQRRLRTIMTAVLLIVMLLSFAIPMIKLSDRILDQVREVPARFARMIVEERPAVPPPPPLRQEETRQAPAPQPEPVARERRPAAETPPAAQSAAPAPTARERAARSGLLALGQDLAEMRSSTIAQELGSRPLQERATAPARTDAARTIGHDTRGSGGIDTSTIARDTGNTRLSERETTRIASREEAVQTATTSAERGALASRTSEEIQMVFDRNKGALNTLYNRALRANPALAGKVVLRLVIAPGGEVTSCEVVSSELGDPELERRIAARVMMFSFGAREVAATAITYPIDFFPG